MVDLKRLNDATLWLILSDIGAILGSRTHKKQPPDLVNVDNVWIELAAAVKNELDERLFNAYGSTEDEKQ